MIMVSLTLVHVVMFAFLSVLCGAVFVGLRRQSSLAWLALAMLLGSIEMIIISASDGTAFELAAAALLVPAAYLSIAQAVRVLLGQTAQHRVLIGAVASLSALSLALLALGVPFPIQTVPFQLACALALAESIYRLSRSDRGLWDMLLMAVLGGIATVFLIRIPLYPVIFGFDASFVTIRESGFEKTLLTTSGLLTPPAVFLLLGRIIGSVISTYRSRAERDGLTGLYNRRALDEMAGVPDLAGGAVIFCDIDHFKRVNDRFGHQVGDQVIRAFATLIEHTGYRAARIGGEEFVLLLSGKSAVEAAEVAEMIRQRFQLIAHPGIAPEDRPTASFGVATYPAGAPPVSAFVMADGALYGAKEAGRNRVVALGTLAQPDEVEDQPLAAA
ncbi:GGDEF domain-containing protein [Devosia sp. ZB163]|uniref:GGDEF domain-containing protein n=1 Tax=Devosia sp. ZB163 TaxID=3025938 RepID=UPI00235F69B6|nr:GGDEF domain-containing protein [Devosia sp. ZB163]MDC9822803.1 GGDEF domain-containing protein [Devosia sp. ZB163]